MRRKINALLGTFTLLAVYGAASAESLSAQIGGERQILPVLVKVNSGGRVTDITPSTRLPPKLNRLLQSNLEKIVTGPARDASGRAISSQFVANMALDSMPMEDGNKDVSFSYLSSQPVPAGSWFWSHTDNRQLALVNRDRFRGPGQMREPSQRMMSPPPQSNSGQSPAAPPAGSGKKS